MSKITKAALVLLATGVIARFFVTPASSKEEKTIAELNLLIDKLKPLHTPLGKPEPGDWLIEHPENGQTFAQYLLIPATAPHGKRNVIYVQPLGKFTESQRKIVKLTADFMGRYFDRQAKVMPDLPLSVIPESARRKRPSDGEDQILTTYVLNSVLKPTLPKDAVASIAFTAADLWPGEGWNFVFGQASLRDRVGVWSIHRNGDPDAGEEEFRLCLLRAMKTATHETGHMLSIEHCTQYECNMCGSNNRGESDRRPVEVCPECLAKICWATNCDPSVRFRKLANFCREHKFETEQKRYEQLFEAVAGKGAQHSR